MFRRLRSKIIFSFCLLMAAGGSITTLLVGHNLSVSLASAAERGGLALTRTLASQLRDPVAFADRLEVRRPLIHAKEASADLVYLFVVSPDGVVTDHSFNRDGFPQDLLKVCRRQAPTHLHSEDGLVVDLPAPILNISGFAAISTSVDAIV